MEEQPKEKVQLVEATKQGDAAAGPEQTTPKSQSNFGKNQMTKRLQPTLNWRATVDVKVPKLPVKDTQEEKHGGRLEKPRASLTPGRAQLPRKNLDKSEEILRENSSESEEEEEPTDLHQEANMDSPSEYWQIQKLVKYLKNDINSTYTIELV
ncbi:outer dynein arm-docking complex subunit 2-like [Ochotona princeps]|uniref:outer dynein arm-docking complex subunit 2-like n=1 Tax=Ochotona princeps TaxID=9978 RepID=UPI002714C6F7|nr:outer dynein arm-docking complex subunit 2-like [Ochotona princeps]